MNSERKSNFELMRIVCMFFIVMHHYVIHGGFEYLEGGYFSLPIYGLQSLAIGGKLGVVCFILLSGYFLIDYQKDIKKKAFGIWRQVFFWSTVSLVISCILKINSLTNINEIIKSLSPIISEQYWFASSYFVLLLVSPLINRCFSFMNRKELEKILCCAVIVWSLLPTIWNLVPTSPKPTYQYSSLLWFCIIYMIGGYIKQYIPHKNENVMKCFSIFFICWIGIMIYIGIIDFLGDRYGLFKNSALQFSDTNSILITIMAIALFLGFRNLNIRNSKIINFVAKTTFGVYLIHDNPYMRILIWKYIFKNVTYINSSYLFFHVVVSTILVFCVCSFLESVRILIGKRMAYCDNVYYKVLLLLKRGRMSESLRYI